MQRSFLDDLDPPPPEPEPHPLEQVDAVVRERLEAFYRAHENDEWPDKSFFAHMRMHGDRDPAGLLSELLKLGLIAKSGGMFRMTWIGPKQHFFVA